MILMIVIMVTVVLICFTFNTVGWKPYLACGSLTLLHSTAAPAVPQGEM